MIGAVSPHPDDVALSCGSFVGAHPGSLMVTVFADGPATVDPLPPWESESGSFMPGDDVAAARRSEDHRAAETLGASSCHVGFWDFQYRRTKYGYRGPKADDSLAEDIATELAQLVGQADLDRWLIPLGILHPDHQLTARACLDVAARLPEVDWILYEELPYAVAYPEERDRSLALLAERGFELVTVEGTEGADPALKRRAIECYRSQLGPLGVGIETAVTTPERLFRLVPVSTA